MRIESSFSKSLSYISFRFLESIFLPHEYIMYRIPLNNKYERIYIGLFFIYFREVLKTSQVSKTLELILFKTRT